MKKFTDEEIKIAKDFSLSYLAECLGYSLLKRGNHMLTTRKIKGILKVVN